MDKQITFIYPGSKIKGTNISCMYGVEIIAGTDYADTIDSGFGADILIGMEGNDILDASHGDAIFWGGEGNDSYKIAHGNSIVFLDKNWGIDVHEGGGDIWLILSSGLDVDKLNWTGKGVLSYKGKSSITFLNSNAYLNTKIVKSNINF